MAIAAVLLAASSCSSPSDRGPSATGKTATAATERRTDGPLAIPGPSTAWFSVEEDEVFSEGFTILRSSADLTIEQVRPTGDLDALTFLGARLGLPGRPDDFNQRMPGYPPRAVPAGYQEDAVGATMEADAGYMLILGFRVDESSVGFRKGVEVDYDVDGTGYTAVLTAQVVTCPPPLTEESCGDQYPATWQGAS